MPEAAVSNRTPDICCDSIIAAERDIAAIAFRVGANERAIAAMTQEFRAKLDQICEELKELREADNSRVPVWVVPVVGVLTTVIGALGAALGITVQQLPH